MQAQTTEQLLVNQPAEVVVWDVVVNLLLSAVLAAILAWVYVRVGRSFSNRGQFARNFVLLAITTTLVVTVVKSSLALSLGLVGALSIVRFRAPIKEPEELAYLFLAIGIGLGLGAGQRTVTAIAFAVIVAVIFINRWRETREDSHNLFLTVQSDDPGAANLDHIVAILKRHCSLVNLRRFDAADGRIEASFQVGFPGLPALQQSRAELQQLNQGVKVTFVDHTGLA